MNNGRWRIIIGPAWVTRVSRSVDAGPMAVNIGRAARGSQNENGRDGKPGAPATLADYELLLLFLSGFLLGSHGSSSSCGGTMWPSPRKSLLLSAVPTR
jgi:hypothetical protein